MSRRDLLVEIGVEELPPRSLLTLSESFASGIVAGLRGAGIRHGRVQRYATPRRLAVFIKGASDRQPDQEVKRRGPPVSVAFDANGAPTRAAQAFAESCQTSVEALRRVVEGKGEFLFFSGVKPGAPTRALLPGIVQSSLDALPIPKRMRWGDSDVSFVRPVHWIVMLLGNEIVPARLLGVESGNSTWGHRFHAPKPLRVSSPATYARLLLTRGYVVADFDERKERIRSGVIELARQAGGEPVGEEALWEEVTALTEWPVPILGNFDARFLQLPREVLIATLQHHQRYFPVASGDRLLPHFVAVANLASRDPDQVRAGNERVVLPRLSDAEFFYTQDRKQTLASRLRRLEQVAFQTRLGSMADKTRRVQALVKVVAAQMGGVNEPWAVRAAELAKCDLVTSMVGEFPQLQGAMGRYYALHDGEPEEVAQAIEEHYLPRFAGDRLPGTRTGMALAIADKLDTLAGIFAIGQKPSGTRDPFGLRRAALGLLRIVLEMRLEIDLRVLIETALRLARADIERTRQTAGGAETAKAAGKPQEEVARELYDYIMERLRGHYLEAAAQTNGITTEMFDAVLATQPTEPLDFDARLQALRTFMSLPQAAGLAAANKRIANILRQAGEQVPEGAPDEQALRHPAEQTLFQSLRQLGDEASKAFVQRDYPAGLKALASLREPVDAFFDSVMVMDPDLRLRANRLKLLRELRQLFLRVVDLSRLPG